MSATWSVASGTACSARIRGHPFGSLAPYALDADGRPLFLLSALAVHTRNLRADPRASLLVAADAGGGDPLASARASLFGTVVEVEASAARDAYLAAHPDAAQWVEFGDFAFHRLEVSNVYYVAGFGEMGWVSGTDYANAITARRCTAGLAHFSKSKIFRKNRIPSQVRHIQPKSILPRRGQFPPDSLPVSHPARGGCPTSDSAESPVPPPSR